jgi:hypothetical protein
MPSLLVLVDVIFFSAVMSTDLFYLVKSGTVADNRTTVLNQFVDMVEDFDHTRNR